MHHVNILDYTKPGKPKDNCYMESFNDKFWDECLNENWITNIGEGQTHYTLLASAITFSTASAIKCIPSSEMVG
jgi:hypothetical protein